MISTSECQRCGKGIPTSRRHGSLYCSRQCQWSAAKGRRRHGPCRCCATLEREGLLEAVQAAVALLDGHGLDKHGVRRWESLSTAEIRSKLDGHLRGHEPDHESGKDPSVHALVRLMQLTQRKVVRHG